MKHGKETKEESSGAQAIEKPSDGSRTARTSLPSIVKDAQARYPDYSTTAGGQRG
jgi:hypothetical protein